MTQQEKYNIAIVSQTLIHSGKDAGLERQASHSSSQNLAGSLHEGKTTFDGFKEVIVDEKSYRVALYTTQK
ncbi:hypothetical protein PtA15_17A282 [Puccinia triticina]|uniref:Uncharacterized protein n=1 Tax=Puccinia triticina TaxID=208348 RepID=A0ABY7D6E1_9BASI|nr:uncharacterized protein PtA15_17A282 [Puccinia triticina]WAQ92800.1 hypothetical protein PtA15_17A282 [Puccinia triticina]WAR63703.1 hypothetical protein PtB15_17B304 [Puccinia triticina]